MSVHASDLLADLAQAYFVEQPRQDSWGASSSDDGIRHHRFGGLRSPGAAWYLGPFTRLLRADFLRGLQLVDAMLERGARIRLQTHDDPFGGRDTPSAHADETPGLELDLLGTGTRLYVGDSPVWSWYRGSSVGPYPCMSALMSLELLMDAYVDSGASARQVAVRVLRDATTLATAGLVFGFLVRHLDQVTDELDGFLCSPDVWHLEFGRAVSERGGIHVQGPDPEGITGKERRLLTPRDVATQLVIRAALSGDHAVKERLRTVGANLLDRAGGESAPAHIRQWAAGLDSEAYTFTPASDGVLIEMNPGDEVRQELEADRGHSALLGEMYRLMNRYSIRAVSPYRQALADSPTAAELAADFQVAETLQAQLLDEPLDMVRSALAGVAAAVLVQSDLPDDIADDATSWALHLLLDSALHPFASDMAIDSTVSPRAADRVAAMAIPCAFSPIAMQRLRSALADLDEFSQGIAAALTAGTTSVFLETRRNASEGIGVILGEECDALAPGRCIHEVAWEAVLAGARHVVLGPRDGSGRRGVQDLEGDLASGLANAATEDLMLTHLAPAVASILHAASGTSCISGRATELAPCVLKAYARAACHWADKNYGGRDEWLSSVAAAVVCHAANCDDSLVLEVAELLGGSQSALGRFLSDLSVVATYEPAYVSLLNAVWPDLMRVGLDAVRLGNDTSTRYDRQELVRSLVSDPSPSPFVPGYEELGQSARANWMSIGAVAGRIDQWLPLATGQMECIDKLVGFLYTQDAESQANPGLRWVRTLVVKPDGTPSTSGFMLVEWLAHMRDSGVLKSDALIDYRAIVDALVLGGYQGARDLQSRDE